MKPAAVGTNVKDLESLGEAPVRNCHSSGLLSAILVVPSHRTSSSIITDAEIVVSC